MQSPACIPPSEGLAAGHLGKTDRGRAVVARQRGPARSPQETSLSSCSPRALSRYFMLVPEASILSANSGSCFKARLVLYFLTRRPARAVFCKFPHTSRRDPGLSGRAKTGTIRNFGRVLIGLLVAPSEFDRGNRSPFERMY